MKEKAIAIAGVGAIASILLYIQHKEHQKEMMQLQFEKETEKLKAEVTFARAYNKSLQEELKHCSIPTSAHSFDLDALMRDFEQFKKTLK